MKILKVLGGIGLIAGGLALAFFGSKKDENIYSSNCQGDIDSQEDESSDNDEIIDDGRDLNPYNRPDCLVPPEAYNDKHRGNRRSDDFFEEPYWVRRAKLYAEGIPNIARGLLNTVSDTYQLYGTCRAGQDVDTYMEEYNNRYSYQPRRMNNYNNGGYYNGNGNHRFYY